jgi:hypothetical protein
MAMGGKGGWCRYHLHVPIVWKSGSLNILEPSGPVMALLLFLLHENKKYFYSLELPALHVYAVSLSGNACT